MNQEVQLPSTEALNTSGFIVGSIPDIQFQEGDIKHPDLEAL